MSKLYLSLSKLTPDTISEPHPAAYPINPSVNRIDAKDCKDPHTVKTEQQMHRRQQMVRSANKSGKNILWKL